VATIAGVRTYESILRYADCI